MEQNNRQFLFVIAPNKNSLYPEYMPKRYIKTSEQNNYSLLQAEMKKENKLCRTECFGAKPEARQKKKGNEIIYDFRK